MQRGYAICTTQRSGSTYLCRLAASTGVLGHPSELFDAGARSARGLDPHAGDPEAQFASIMVDGATPNGVYGLKLFPPTFDYVASTRWATRLPNLSFVFLRRYDLLGQALSQARARQTLQWTSFHEPTREAVYDGVLIRERLLEIMRHNARWEFYFARNGIRPINLYYEDLLADPAPAIGAIARAVGLSGEITIDMSAIYIRIQRTQETEEWRARFVAESRDLNVMHA